MALSVGMLGGGLAQILSQWPSLRREGYRHQWILNPRDPVLREVLVLMGPGTLGVAAAQINLLVNTWLATSVDGAAASLRFAFQLMYLPIGIFGVSVATATIPDLARQAAEGAHDEMVTTVSWAIRLMIVLSVPAIVGLIVLAGPIVELIYQRGQFNSESTLMTAGALAFYAPGILGYSIVKIASPSFYSLREARTPVLVSVDDDHREPRAESLAQLDLQLQAAWRSARRSRPTSTPACCCSCCRGASAAATSRGSCARSSRPAWRPRSMGAAAYYTQAWLQTVFTEPHLAHRLIRVGGAIGVGLGVLAAMAHLLRLEEFGAGDGARTWRAMWQPAVSLLALAARPLSACR